MRLWVIACLLCFAGTSVHAIQVLPAPQSGIGQQNIEGLGGLFRGLQIASDRKKAEKLLQEQAEQAEREKTILFDIVKDYDPAKNNEFVLKILQSELSLGVKTEVINILNVQHKLYLEEQRYLEEQKRSEEQKERKKGGICSWFKK